VFTSRDLPFTMTDSWPTRDCILLAFLGGFSLTCLRFSPFCIYGQNWHGMEWDGTSILGLICCTDGEVMWVCLFVSASAILLFCFLGSYPLSDVGSYHYFYPSGC
jgi:hypothetical protein